MNKKFIIVLASVLLIAMLPLNAFASLPHMNDMYSVICGDETIMMTKARGGEIDNLMDIRMPSNVEELEGLGWSISANPAYSIHISNINCRPYYPETAGELHDYHGRKPGDSNYPLNLSEFRFALKLIISGSQMKSWVSEIFSWTQIPLDTVITPAHGYWYNTKMTVYGYEPDLAYNLLITHGWTYTGTYSDGHCSGGYWYTPQGTELRHVYVACCIEAQHSTAAISMRECAAWNYFFGKNSEGEDYFVDESLSWTFNDLMDITFNDRDFDISSHGWSLGKNPDFLYDFFHPDVDVAWGDNAPGFSDPTPGGIDDMEYAVKNWRWPNGTYITELSDMIDLVWDVQEALYYVEPFMLTYCSIYVNAYAPDVAGWSESLGYGSDISWTYNYIGWAASGTSIRMCVSSDPKTLNPGWVSTVYDHQILDRIEDGLWEVEPVNHVDLMWASSDWSMTPWSDEGIGVEYGQKVTFTIREGIYWQDGQVFDANDVKFAYDFIANLSLAQYADIVTTYVYSDIVNPYTIDVYMNCTGLWYTYTYAGAGALFPPQIWAGFMGNAAGAEAFKPWEENYDTFTGSSGHNGLTCLIGIGAWIFVEWDKTAKVVHLIANRPDAMWTGNPGWFAENWYTELAPYNNLPPGNTDWDSDVDQYDFWAFCAAFIDYYSKGSMNIWDDFDCNGVINQYDFWAFCDYFINYWAA